MKSSEVVDIIHQALRGFKTEPRINDVSYDGDGDSAEVILTTDDGKNKQVWVISSSTIEEAEDDSLGGTCHKCGTDLDEKGLCKDVTCPYNTEQQSFKPHYDECPQCGAQICGEYHRAGCSIEGRK